MVKHEGANTTKANDKKVNASLSLLGTGPLRSLSGPGQTFLIGMPTFALKNLTKSSSRMEIETRTALRNAAGGMSRRLWSETTASGAVSYMPATIMVAPVSPRLLARERIIPAMSPDFASGDVTS